jgi:hypothetical protein
MEQSDLAMTRTEGDRVLHHAAFRRKGATCATLKSRGLPRPAKLPVVAL